MNIAEFFRESPARFVSFDKRTDNKIVSCKHKPEGKRYTPTKNVKRTRAKCPRSLSIREIADSRSVKGFILFLSDDDHRKNRMAKNIPFQEVLKGDIGLSYFSPERTLSKIPVVLS